jgi:MFS family permease
MSIDLVTRPLAAADGGSDRRRSPALAVILVAAFMDLLDAGIVFLALPHIHQDLHASYTALQWVAAGYTLAFATAADHRRPAWRHAWPQAAVPGRGGRLHRRLRAVRRPPRAQPC